MKILIVDDSPIVRARLITMLDDLTHVNVVGQAKSGEEALEALPRLKPDAVILDIRMPGQSGVEVLEKIKKTNPAPKVIMLTNFPYEQYRDRCLESGADYFFDKSSEFNKVIDVVSKLANEGVERGRRALTPSG